MDDKKGKPASLFALEEVQKTFEMFVKENVDDIVEMVKAIRKEESLK